MMLDGGKIKEIQVKLLLSSRSEMHKVIEAARQTVPILSLAPPVAAPSPAPAPAITPFSSVIATGGLPGFGIPGLGNPQEIPQPAVIEPPQPLLISPVQSKTPEEEEHDDKSETKRKDRRRTRSRSRSRDRDRKDRKRDRRDRSRSRERRRRDRSRSRDRRDRKRDRKDRSRSRERSPRRSRDKRRSPQSSQERSAAEKANDGPPQTTAPGFPNAMNQMLNNGQPQMGLLTPPAMNGPAVPGRYADPALKEAFNKLQELGKKRNPHAFQGDQSGPGGRPAPGRGGNNNTRGGGNNGRRDGRSTRFDDQPKDCCVAIRNAPNHTSYGDVRRFFPFMIDKHGIKMINDNMGRRTGSIFVRFCDPRSKQLALQKQPNELKGATVAVESLDDELYDSAVDSFLPYRDDNDVQEPNCVVDQDNRRPAFTFSVLKLVDLPHFVKEHDIVKAFNEFSLLSILLKDCRLSRTKIAFVQFVKPDDARKALERKESYLFGRRQPVITPVTDDEYENEKNTDEKLETQNSLPNAESVPEAVVPRDPRQRRQNDNGTGAYIQQQQPVMFVPNGPYQQNFGPPFANPQFAGYPGGNMDPRAAAANWANQNMAQQGHGPHLARSAPNNAQVINLDADEEPLDCVLMKGLPREATDRTILDFLSDTGAVPARIHLMLDTTGRPSGDCFCEFRTSQDARQAVTKHGNHLDGNRITVDLVMRSVVEEALEGPKTEPKREMYGNGPPLLSNPPNVVPQMFDAPQNFAGRGGYRGRGFQRGGFDRGGYNNRGGFDPSRGGGFRGRGGWNERGRGFDRGRGRGFSRGRGGYGGGDFDGRDSMRHDEEDPGLEDFGAPGCVVSMENVPFRATVDDILGFFGDYDLTQDDVIRRYNERGQPTGDARVAFPSPSLAQRAVNSLNMNQIFDRRVSLTLL